MKKKYVAKWNKRLKKKDKRRKRNRTRKRLTRRERYSRYIKSGTWKKLRKQVFALFGKVCCECGSKKKLQVHHLTYERIFHESVFDLCVLCEDCHKKHHEMKKRRVVA